jgi:hypothetical protein
MRCSPLKVKWHFRWISVAFQWTVWCFIPEDRTPDNYCFENLKFYMYVQCSCRVIAFLHFSTSVMPVDQDWGNVWPGPWTFHPASVPLPVRQGYNEKEAPLEKFGNAELMKIPNFLHLIPPVIKRQCEALKSFCNAWPQGLKRDANCEESFPLEIITSDYCHSSPGIRDPLARIVTIKVNCSIWQSYWLPLWFLTCNHSSVRNGAPQ